MTTSSRAKIILRLTVALLLLRTARAFSSCRIALIAAANRLSGD